MKNIEPKKNTHGGARKGAGRKPSAPEDKKVVLSLWVHPRDIPAIRKFVSELKNGQGG